MCLSFFFFYYTISIVVDITRMSMYIIYNKYKYNIYMYNTIERENRPDAPVKKI